MTAFSRRLRLRVAAAAIASAMACVPLLVGVASAQSVDAAGHLSKWPINPDDPSSSVPSDEDLAREPLQAGYFLMDLSGDADALMRRQDYARAINYFKAMQKMVPDRAISFAKECECHEALGERALAIESCKIAVNRSGMRVGDAERYVRVLTSAPEGPTPGELTEAQAVLDHLRKEKVSEVSIAQIECDLAVQLDDEARLKSCSAVLEAKAPKDPKTVSYLWSLAVKQGNYSEATRLLARAKEAGMPQPALDKMLEGTRSVRWAWLTKGWRLLLGALALGGLAAGLLVLGRRSRGNLPRSVETASS